MKWIKTLAAMTAFATLTSGCAMYELEELRHTTPTGTPFQKELAKLYMDFATEDEKGYDWFNSWYFADKGLRSAYGKDVAPEEIKEWEIPATVLPYMQKGREALLSVLTPKNEEAHPTTAAQAQFSFDCWVQRQEENWQIERIDNCRNALASALNELGAGNVILAAPATAPAQAQQPQAKTEMLETMSYIVFFAGNRPVITDPGEKVLGEVIASLKEAQDYQIILKPGTDSVPHSKLFDERAQAVNRRLVEGGIKAEAIKPDTGESTTDVKTIEIYLSQ